MDRLFRRGFWFCLLRVARGLPGPLGYRKEGHFYGGLAGAQAIWPLGSEMRLGLCNAVPVAATYCFGILWPNVLRSIGLPNNAQKLILRLEQEFGLPSDYELRCTPIPEEAHRMRA